MTDSAAFLTPLGASPDWPAPPRVRALITTRQGGVSQPPFDSLNFGNHVGDAPKAVATNRARLIAHSGVPVRFLTQVHGVKVVDAARCEDEETADAAFVHQPGLAACILTADCLPVLFCTQDGTEVAAAHAGWRGLCAGVLEATLATFSAPPQAVMAWLGPCIGKAAFEVGEAVFTAFVSADEGAHTAFSPSRPGHWQADLQALAKRRLLRAGVTAVFGAPRCTYRDAASFFSYRREGQTGRMASLIWIAH